MGNSVSARVGNYVSVRPLQLGNFVSADTSGARAVQIVHSQRRGSRDIEHVGSVHTDADLELLKAVARQRLAAGQGELDLRLPGSPANQGAVLPITSSRMGHLLDGLCRGYDAVGFGAATGRDEVFKALVLARIIEPTSKLDCLRVLAEGWHGPAVVSDGEAAAAGLRRRRSEPRRCCCGRRRWFGARAAGWC
jgi:hypothetical protein